MWYVQALANSLQYIIIIPYKYFIFIKKIILHKTMDSAQNISKIIFYREPSIGKHLKLTPTIRT